MLIRSSSTPVLGSLIPYSDNNRENAGRAKPLSGSANQFCFHSTNSHTQLHSSYDTCSVDDEKEINSISNFRRVRSEGNLENLLSRGSPVQAKIAAETFLEGNSFGAFNLNSLNKRWSRRLPTNKRLPSLKSIPSFSSYCNEEDQDGSLENYANALESVMQDFSFGDEGTSEIAVKDLATEQGMVPAEPMFMAQGLGMDVMEPPTDMGGGRGNFTSKSISTGGGGSGGDGYGSGSENVEEYYEGMLEDNPANALILSNYAQFLYETKHDYHKAEDYYSRAILAHPGEGGVLAQYAKLIWELHGDEERASAYFEQAVQASPEDCHVQAAYASFLWNTDTEEEDKEHGHSSLSSYSPNSYEIVGPATATVR